MDKIRLLIADDHKMFRAGIGNLLAKEAEFEVVGEASDGAQAIELSHAHRPDVVLMDLCLPKIDGIATTRAILAQHGTVRVLALTASVDEKSILNMINAGANGYVLKDAPIEELILAIKVLSRGSSYFAKEVSAKLFSLIRQTDVPTTAIGASEDCPLTGREMEVLRHIAEEMTNKEIAKKLFISPRTVETHRRNLINKLKVKNTVGLVKYYLFFLQGSRHVVPSSAPRSPQFEST